MKFCEFFLVRVYLRCSSLDVFSYKACFRTQFTIAQNSNLSISLCFEINFNLINFVANDFLQVISILRNKVNVIDGAILY